jgi:hypothetical protein
MSIKTLFNNNINLTEKNLFINNEPTTTTTNIVINIDEDIYKTLATYSETVQNLLLQFSLGNFKQVSTILNRKYYQYLSVKLANITYIDYPIYEQLRQSIKKSLQGLYKAIEQYNVLANTKEILKTTQERASILDDMQKLRDYVNNLKKNVSIFPEMNVTIIRAEIKPEYAEYIKLYGYPQGGIFDMDRLADILINMELNNLI